MLKMFFFIRYRAQLRRTRPELIASLDDAVAGAISAAGGRAENGRRVLTASFDENRIGFWLDMVILLEKVQKALENTSNELYGHSLILGQNIPETYIQKFCLVLSGGEARASAAGTLRRDREESGSKVHRISAKNRSRGSTEPDHSGSTGIWCSRSIRKALEPYLVFGNPINKKKSGPRDTFRLNTEDSSEVFDPGGYSELREWKPFDETQREYPYRGKIVRALAQGTSKNTILFGPDFVDKWDSLYHYCTDLLGDTPPLAVRFGAGGQGLICFADAYTPRIRSFISEAASKNRDSLPAKTTEELDTMHAQLFRERLREEWSPYMVDQSRAFIRLLLTSYIAAVKDHLPRGMLSRGILIIENPSFAGMISAKVFVEAYSSLDDRKGLQILASDSSSEEGMKEWGGIFLRGMRFSAEDFLTGEGDAKTRKSPGRKSAAPPPSKNEVPKNLPQDLWELSYNIFLLGRYFPSYLFPQLFEEEGLNRDVYFRVLKILTALGAATPDYPSLFIQDFMLSPEKNSQKGNSSFGPGIETQFEKIRSAVRKRILDWTAKGKLCPCFNLLRILSELGEQADDILVLKSIKADALNGTLEGIEEALREGYFVSLVGKGNAPVLSYIYKSLKTLVRENKDDIQQVFLEPLPSFKYEDGSLCYAGYRAQTETNLAAYYIGSQDAEAASESVRKAMLLNRELGKDPVPAYRLFSLVNLSKQRIDDALEYISFALEQAERTEQADEVLLTCYFASSINFLYGNFSKSGNLAAKAEKTALDLGQSGWAARAKLLRGRSFFEIGQYEEALEIFQSLVDTAKTNEADVQSRMMSILRAWLNRTKVFSGLSPSPKRNAATAGLDERIFEIEAAYFAGDFKKAASLAERFLSSSDEEQDNFIYTEQPDWRSGFAQCENMLQPGKAPGTRFAMIYRAMAKSALHPSGEAKAEILDGMQRFMRDELLPDTDPNDSFYFHAWHCVLKNTGADQVDLNTAVSMGYRRLQRRAGRIDDKDKKQAYLTLPRWNNVLCLAAREYKLI